MEKVYLEKGRRVFSRENCVVHYGESGFGNLIVEGEEEVYVVFVSYIIEVEFEPILDDKTIRGYKEIKEESLPYRHALLALVEVNLCVHPIAMRQTHGSAPTNRGFLAEGRTVGQLKRFCPTVEREKT